MLMIGEKLEGGRRIDPSNGLIMPWYTSPCLEWLNGLDLKGKEVYEYGVGDSSYWYTWRGAIVDGVDSHIDWVRSCPVAMFTTNKKTYIESVNCLDTMYDIIVIDGDWRDECTEYALSSLKSGGYLIIDNYKQPSADLEHWPLTEKLIEGMEITIYKEPDHEDWQTAVITKL
jgi:hypothetical protein